jgi:hypothetical protein
MDYSALNAYEKNKLRLIKQATMEGRGNEVSFADKQWVLDMCARMGTTLKVELLDKATADGYNVAGIPALM